MTSAQWERRCAACGDDISARDIRARYCSESCAKRRPCLRCGQPKPKVGTTRGTRYCPACQEVVDSRDYIKATDRERHRARRLAKIAEGIAEGVPVRRRPD